MTVEQPNDLAAAATESDMSMAVDSDTAAAVSKKLKKFGKVKVRERPAFLPARKKAQIKERSASAAPIHPSLGMKKSRGIRKPSAIMRKTLKKLQKKREMDLG